MKQPENIKKRKNVMDDVVSELSSFLSGIEEKYGLGFDQIQRIIHDVEQARSLGKETIVKLSDNVPICIFRNDKLSILEAIVKYLRENIGMKYSEIATILKRDMGPIGVTYRNAKRKMPSRFVTTPSLPLPVAILKNRKLSVLENIVSFFRNKGMKYSEIASILNRNDRTIWTVSKRAELKLTGIGKKKSMIR